MPGVVTKCIQANPIRAARVVIYTNKAQVGVNNMIQTLAPKIDRQAGTGIITAKYSGRFDDNTYYTS